MTDTQPTPAKPRAKRVTAETVESVFTTMHSPLASDQHCAQQLAELNASIADLGRISRLDYREEFAQVYAGTYDALGEHGDD